MSEMRRLTFNDYGRYGAAIAVYPNETAVEGINFCVLGLVGEAGELANKLKKVYRDEGGVLTKEKRDELRDELGDVLWYVDRLAAELDTNLETVAKENMAKLASRKARGTPQGSGDKR